MFANVQNLKSTFANPENAHRLLAANLDYHLSNDSHQSLDDRKMLRSRCREQILDIMVDEPDHPAALGLLGRLELDEGHLARARELFDRSLSINPDQSQQLLNLGYWAMASQRPDWAQTYFEQALELDPESMAGFRGIAHALRDQGKFDAAYLHYRKLLDLGVKDDFIFQGLCDCAERLAIHKADAALRADAIRLLSHPRLPHHQLGRFVVAILRLSYDLESGESDILLDDVASDELMLLALERCILPDPWVEAMIVGLRRTLLIDTVETAELTDDRQRLACALAVYGASTNYLCVASPEEIEAVAAINQSLAAQLVMGESPEYLVGSLIISAMYGSLFRQSFSSDLGRWAITDWPVGLQTLMNASYYEPAREENARQMFAEKAAEVTLAAADVPAAWPLWTQLRRQNETTLRQILATDIGVSTDKLPDTLRILIMGRGCGQQALELATYLKDTEVIAVDESLANVGRGTREAEDLGLNNIVFWPMSLARQFVADGHRMNWLEIQALPADTLSHDDLVEFVNTALASEGILHLHTGQQPVDAGSECLRRIVRQHELDQSRGTVQKLRQIALNAMNDPQWQTLLESPDFYNLDGCRARWFSANQEPLEESLVEQVCNQLVWRLVKAVDDEGTRLKPALVLEQLITSNRHGEPLNLYFQRR